MPESSAPTQASEPTPTPTIAQADDVIARAESLWQAFFSLHAMTDAQTDGAGGCVLSLNGRRAVVCCWPDDALLLIQVHIIALPKAPTERGALCEALLIQASNIFEGDVLAVDGVDDAAVYQRCLDVMDLDASDLTAELWDMVDAAADVQSGLVQVG